MTDLENQAESLALLLAKALKRITDLEDRAAKTAGASPDHFSQALAYLRSGPCTISRLAKVCGLSRSQGRNLAHRLEAEGLVLLRRDPTRRDERISVILTKEGRSFESNLD